MYRFLLLFALCSSPALADDIVTFDFTHDTGLSQFVIAPFQVPSTVGGILPPDNIFAPFIGPVEWVMLPYGLQIWDFCDLPGCDWAMLFKNQFPINVVYGPGSLAEGTFVPGVYQSTSGTVLTITAADPASAPEPGTATLLILTLILSVVAGTSLQGTSWKRKHLGSFARHNPHLLLPPRNLDTIVQPRR